MMADARGLFDEMSERNIVFWSILIHGYVRCGYPKQTLELYQRMLVEGVRTDQVRVVGVISACLQLGALDQGRWIHSYMKKNSRLLDVVTETALVEMYIKCGDLQHARLVFNRMPKRSFWVKTCRTASKRFHNKISLTGSSDQGIRCSPLSSKALNCSAGRRDSKTPIAATKKSIVSFQSLFHWSNGIVISSKDVLPSNITRGTYLESNQFPLPLHSYQTSQMRQCLTNSTPWFSPSPHHASWVVPSHGSPFDSTTHHSSAITSETSQVTPARDTSKFHAANMQFTSPSALLPRQDTPSIFTVMLSEIQNKEASPVGIKSPSTREKSKKRKNISALEEPLLNISTPQSQSDSASAICH
ncbi:hypothetical protein ZIOFF_024160 [Zingiber officinale]|uniref:Pentatricopeptide repeat-containing protein n=2 Tax=Zingiber officinale TaxID=94328 RepID=A0A8J5GXU9_ZINOF|nr:hypothetical protein ZIOFF_024160 [Zingiber officinale]